jgi:hypothetical protein
VVKKPIEKGVSRAARRYLDQEGAKDTKKICALCAFVVKTFYVILERLPALSA